jgi:hypothetical protein
MSTYQQPMMMPPGPYYPMAPAYPPPDRRTANIIVLGAILLAAFACPVLAPKFSDTGGLSVRPYFLNVEGLGESMVPGVVKFQLVYPAIAGLALIILAPLLRNFIRSVCILVLGLIPVIVALGSSDVRDVVTTTSREFVGASSGASIVLGCLAFIGLYAGARARWYRPGSLAAYIAGAVGGGLYLVQLILPVLPEAMGTLPIVCMVKMLNVKGLLVVAIGSIVQTACFVAAAIICLANYPRKTPSVRGTASAAFTLLTVGIVVFLVSIPGNVLYAIGSQAGKVEALAIGVLLMSLVKMGLWAGGLLLLIPFGATDLIVWLSRPTDFPQPMPAVMPPGMVMPVPIPAAMYPPPMPPVPMPPPAMPRAAAPPGAPAGPVQGPPVISLQAATPEARLQELQRMLQKGLITENEYQAKRKEILGQI